MINREDRLEAALLMAHEHLIMNDANGPRVDEKIKKALHGYYCQGCQKLLMPTNTIEAIEHGGSMVYVHKDNCTGEGI